MEITQVQGFNQTQYEPLIQEAQAKGVSRTSVDQALLAAVAKNQSFSEAVDSVRTQLPELQAPRTNTMPNPANWVALPSPGALMVSLIISNAAEQRQQNRELIFQQGMAQADLIDKQAEKIKEGATSRFACAITGAAVSMAGSAVSLGFSAAGVGRADTGKLTFGSNIDNQLTASFTQAVSGTGSSIGQMFTAGGEFAQGLASAEQKHLEADQERLRTMMEQTKQTNEAMRDLISRGMDFLSSMQANMNQTRTKIMG